MEKDCWWNESNKSGKDTASLETPITTAANTKTEAPITPDPMRWLYSVTKHEPSHNDFWIDSGAHTSVCHQSLAESLGGKPSGAGVELRSATGHQFTSTGNTTILLRTRDGITVAGDFQIAPQKNGLQRSIISVGEVCDRGNIITFRNTDGMILNEFSGERIEFVRARGVYRLRADTSLKMKSGTRGAKMLMDFEQDTAGAAEAQPARPGNVPVLPSESEVEHLPFRSWCRHCERAKGKESPHHT